ncbi:MAG TPA: FecR family protein [Anaerolineales bacterium]|nr:FecR family protein [Anaerolineales bacterium]
MSIKSPRFLISLTLVILTLLTACQPQAASQPAPALALTATVKELTGSVTIKQPGAASFSPASPGMELQVNGSIQTGDDGRVRLDLSTGTIIRVAPSSLFTLTANQPSNGSLSTKLSLSLGGLFVILNGGSASVNTPSGVASVRGSYLSVFVDPSTQTVVVTCLEGQCGAGNSAGNTDFGTGQEVTLFSCTAGQCSVPNVGPMTPEEFQNWLDNNPDLQQIPGLFATMTALVATQPSATEVPPPATFTPAPVSCLRNVAGPHAGSNLDPAGPVRFSWDPKDGASQYKLAIHYPNGATDSFYTSNTSVTRYLESMPSGGSYSWDITVLDSSGNVICQTGESRFSKQQYETPKPPGEHVDCNRNPELPACSCYLHRNFNKPWCEG